MDLFASIIDVFTQNSTIFVATLCACFLAYVTWYFAAGKQYASLTLNEARILWKIHKQNSNCKAKKWRAIRFRGKVIGFECGCGYKHIEKRPLI